MCGICGVFAYGQSEGAVTEELVISMRDRMTHRGPDGAGVWLSKNRKLGLGHRRLSIVDLSPAGAQPMTNEDGTLWITFNGEIYNHLELRAELETKGHRYRSRSDTETLLHGYEEWGESLLDRLQGMFAIALFDEKKQELFLARDRIGVKPIYWALDQGRFLFASEAKAILAAPGFRAQVNPEAFHRYLTFVAAPAPQTLFSGISKLPAGFKMRVSPKGEIKQESWWIPPTLGERRDRPEYQSIEAAEEHLALLLRQAVKKRLMSDVPFGVFLSGGIDSSLNVALMTEAHDQPINTFTVGFKDAPELDEREWARKVASTFGARYHEVLIDEDDMLRYLPSMIWHQDEPIGDCVCVPLYHVAKLLRDSGTTVVQVGEGSDEQFSGYWWSKAYVEFERRFLNSTFGRVVRPFARTARLLANTLGMDPFDLQHLERLSQGEEVFLGGCIALLGEAKWRALGPYYKNGNRPAPHDASTVVRAGLAPLLEARPDASISDRMLFWELRSRLPELLLMRVDKMTMQTSVEARVPFLDHHVVEFSSGLPLDWRIHQGETKHILKRVAAKILPHDVVYRKKVGFGAPTTLWFRSKLGPRFREYLRGSPIRESGLLDLAHVERLLDEHQGMRADHGFHLWVLLNAILWHDRFIAGREISL